MPIKSTKGISDLALAPASEAAANASGQRYRIYFTELPITPEKIAVA